MGSARGTAIARHAHELTTAQTSTMSRRSFLAIVAAAAATAACSGGSDDAASYPYRRESLYYGAATPPDRLAAFEAQLGSRLSCYRSFFNSSQVGSLHSRVAVDLEHGRMPIASIKPPGPWAATARDHAWIDHVVGPLGHLDHKVYLCVHHEPENDAAHYGSPADYVAMQDAVLDAATSTPNVVVVPILGTWSFDDRSDTVASNWNVERAAVYGVDIYNPWSTNTNKGWVPFADKLELAAEEAAGRPMLIGEYGCRSDPAEPGRAAQWLQDALEAALNAGVVAMAYFNSERNSPDGSWELDGETLPVFAEILQGPHVDWLRAR
jgi:hypothetical protein